MKAGPDKKTFSDPDYNAADFAAEVSGGSLRWLATVLAIASLGLLIYYIFDKQEPEMDFPFQLKGAAVYWMVGGAFIIWLLLAIVNWTKWLKIRKR
jgi:hypothetical protein